jgi:hypothetical protein
MRARRLVLRLLRPRIRLLVLTRFLLVGAPSHLRTRSIPVFLEGLGHPDEAAGWCVLRATEIWPSVTRPRPSSLMTGR